MGATEALDRGRSWLRSARNADGSWGYQRGEVGRPEPSVLAIAAGVGSPDPAAWVPAAWIGANDLGWAGLLLPAVAWRAAPEVCEPWLARILSERSTPGDVIEGFDATLPGWSWAPGTAAWVEPTCFAMLSLRRADAGADRAEEGVALLLDRQCDDGGWNYGNPEVLGTRLPSHAESTGWAAMALPGGEAVDRALRRLESVIERPSTLGLGLAALASAAHGRDATRFIDPLAARIGDEGVRGRVDLTAIAVAALTAATEGVHPFA